MIFEILLLLFLLILMLALIFWLLSHIFSTLFYVPYVNASDKAIFDALMLADLKKDEKLLDLGCGRGDALIIGSKKFGANAVGYEISPMPYLIGKFKLRNNKNAKIIRKNFKSATAEIQKADVIYLYLLNSMLEKIESWIFENIKSDARVVTLAFCFPGKKPKKIISTKNLGIETKIHLY